jgi:hypothetical protein
MLELDTTPAPFAALMDGRRRAHVCPLWTVRGRVPVPGDYVSIRSVTDGRVTEYLFGRVTWVEVCEGAVVISVDVKASTMRMPAVVPDA